MHSALSWALKIQPVKFPVQWAMAQWLWLSLFLPSPMSSSFGSVRTSTFCCHTLCTLASAMLRPLIDQFYYFSIRSWSYVCIAFEMFLVSSASDPLSDFNSHGSLFCFVFILSELILWSQIIRYDLSPIGNFLNSSHCSQHTPTCHLRIQFLLGELSGKKPTPPGFIKPKWTHPVAHSHTHPFNHSLSSHGGRGGRRSSCADRCWAEELHNWNWNCPLELCTRRQNKQTLNQSQLSLKSTAQES